MVKRNEEQVGREIQKIEEDFEKAQGRFEEFLESSALENQLPFAPTLL